MLSDDHPSLTGASFGQLYERCAKAVKFYKVPCLTLTDRMTDLTYRREIKANCYKLTEIE